MNMTLEQVGNHLGKLSAKGQNLLDYRRAARSHIITLSDEMGPILGSNRRRSVPVLGVVIEAIANKLHVKDLTLKATTKKLVDQWLKTNHWDLTERKLWEATVRDGHGYILVTPTGNPDMPVQLTFREAYDGQCGAVVCCDDTTGQPDHGVNIWKDGDVVNADLYFPDRIEKYQKNDKGWTQRMDPGDEVWPVDWTDADGQPLGIPLIPFGDGYSDIEGALQLAKDINEALVDLLATSRTQGWPQRFLKGKDQVEYLTNLNGQPIRNSSGVPLRKNIKLTPGSVFVIRGDGDLGQLDGASPDPVLVRTYLELLSWITTVPAFYFTGDWPSGVALMQAESRLCELAEGHQGQFTGSLIAMVRTMLQLARVFGGIQVDPQVDVDVEWHAPQTETEDLVRDREAATSDLFEKGLMSLKTAIKRLHPDWSDEQVAQEVADIQADKKANTPPALQAPGQAPGQVPGQPQDPAAQAQKDLMTRAMARANRIPAK